MSSDVDAQNKELDEKTQRELMKVRAVRQATFEVLGEQQAEVVKRARAKLAAMGIQLSDDEVKL